MPKYCPICGARISDKVNFCMECGAEIREFLVDKNTVPAAGFTTNTLSTQGSAIDRRPRQSRLILYIVGIIVILVPLLAIGAAYYISSHELPPQIRSVLHMDPAQGGGSTEQMGGVTCQTEVTTAPTTLPPTPTPIPTTPETEREYMTRTNGRYLGDIFVIDRNDVTGYKDLKVNVTVYRFRFYDSFNESGSTSLGTSTYITRLPDPGNKFLFVFVRMEVPSSDQTNDPRMWGFGSSLFAVQYKGAVIPQYSKHVKCEPILEMESVGTQDNTVRVLDYGFSRSVSIGGGYGCQSDSYLHFGKSNAWDGYIIYQVPKEASNTDLRVVSSLGGFGNPWWYLY
jgi:hypothetical protein